MLLKILYFDPHKSQLRRLAHGLQNGAENYHLYDWLPLFFLVFYRLWLRRIFWSQALDRQANFYILDFWSLTYYGTANFYFSHF